MSGKQYASSCRRLCKGADHCIQILEKWEGDGHLPNHGGVDFDERKRREKQEDQ